MYEPYSEAVLRDPATSYPHMLDQQPVYWCRGFTPPFCVLSRHADVTLALRDIDTFSSAHGQGPRFTPAAGMLSDPPRHTAFRRLVQQAFTPRSIERMGPGVAALAASMAGELTARGRWDLHDDFAFPLPVCVIAGMLGVPTSDIQRFKEWSDAAVAAMGSEDPSAHQPKLLEMAGYLHDQVQRRRDGSKVDSDPSSGAAPHVDLISGLIGARERGRSLGDDEIVGVITQLLVGGNETTTSLITNAVWRLLESAGQWRRLVANAQLVDAVVEESLRFDPPVLGLFRTTTRDVFLHGERIPSGSKVMLHFAAANRDPRAFDEPDRFAIDRQPCRHLAFGLGVHFCLGAPLARLEAREALLALVRAFPDLTLLGCGERIAPFFLWGRRKLPVLTCGGPMNEPE